MSISGSGHFDKIRQERRNGMFRKVDDFLKAYENVTASTARVFATLTDENLGQPVADGHRTLRHIAWHIVATVPEMMNRTGLGLSSVDPHSAPPESAADITEAYGRASAELVETIVANWTDETLLKTDDMYGEQWLRGVTLMCLIDHEIHHRGQMMVLLRQAGQTVPGVYGPAKEEWSKYGMEEPPY
jgi:uncharacterized damage-inducible protein DinB